MSVLERPVSYCCVCDAITGACDHQQNRYLEAIEYEHDGGGFVVPELERHRFDHPIKATPPPPPGTMAEPLTDLTARLEYHVGLDVSMLRRLERAYELDGLRVTRICASIVRSTEAGQLSSPAGVLWNRLGELVRGDGA